MLNVEADAGGLPHAFARANRAYFKSRELHFARCPSRVFVPTHALPRTECSPACTQSNEQVRSARGRWEAFAAAAVSADRVLLNCLQLGAVVQC
jgi:hypothetical protein